MTGVKAYMTGKIKVKGDLLLAQRLEEIFEKLGGREVRKKNPPVYILIFVNQFYYHYLILACH